MFDSGSGSQGLRPSETAQVLFRQNNRLRPCGHHRADKKLMAAPTTKIQWDQLAKALDAEVQTEFPPFIAAERPSPRPKFAAEPATPAPAPSQDGLIRSALDRIRRNMPRWTR